MEHVDPATEPGKILVWTKPKFMYAIKFIWLLTLELVKQAWLLPQTVTLALQQRRQQRTQHQSEAERLDRIRNPSKYAGR